MSSNKELSLKQIMDFRKAKIEKLNPLTLSKEAKPAVANIGIRPSVSNEGKETFEVHIIGEKLSYDTLYGKKCAFYFESKLRDEKKFSSIEALKTQIIKDIEKAKEES